MPELFPDNKGMPYFSEGQGSASRGSQQFRLGFII